MGTFRVDVQAVGGHGCQRDVKDGEVVQGCGKPNCPDCIVREFVGKLKAISVFSYGVECHAKLIHWPGQPNEVVDDLLTGIRKGNF